MLTPEQARGLVQERFGVTASGEESLLVVEAPAGRWQELGRFARETLGCVYFAFMKIGRASCRERVSY